MVIPSKTVFSILVFALIRPRQFDQSSRLSSMRRVLMMFVFSSRQR